MAFFEDIKKKVVDTTQGAVKATKELAETSRLNSQITDEQRKIGNLYAKIGKLYFDQYGAEAEPPFGEFCVGIVAANEQIAKLQNEIQTVKGLKRCTACGTDIPLSSGFCSKCGAAVEVPLQISEDTVTVVEVVHHCGKCGAELETGATFCSSCGQKTEQSDSTSEQQEQ